MDEKLLTLRELRLRLAGHGCPFVAPPAPVTVRGWIAKGLKTHKYPGGKRKHFLLSEVLAFLKEHGEAK